MKIKYFGHSCFKFEENGYEVVIDPFKDVDGYQNVKTSADMVLCSHDHFDHDYYSGVKRKPSGVQNPFGVTMMKTYHDKNNGADRGENNVHIISVSGKTLVHLGDLGHILNEKQLEYVKNCDLLMIPIGGKYTINSNEAWELIHLINPKVVVPMHYKNGKFGFSDLENLSEFMTKSDRKIAVSTSEYFEIPNEDNLLLIPAVV